jgi:hypothetical protein
MNRHHDKDEAQQNFDAKIAETKAGIERLIEPHAVLPGAGGLLIMALLELGIERHLKRFPDEKAARDLVNGVLNKVLKRRLPS